MFHTSQKRICCVFLVIKGDTFFDVTCWHLHSRLCSFPSCDAALQQCLFKRRSATTAGIAANAWATVILKPLPLEFRHHPVALFEHFRPILSVLPPATAPKAPACPNGAICASCYESYNVWLWKKHLKQEQPPSQGRIPATSYNKIDIAINSHLAGSDPSTAHLMDVPILTNFQSHGVRMFDEKSHLWKKRS
jgi:hypothetical protein